jgi:hypothetical protein
MLREDVSRKLPGVGGCRRLLFQLIVRLSRYIIVLAGTVTRSHKVIVVLVNLFLMLPCDSFGAIVAWGR